MIFFDMIIRGLQDIIKSCDNMMVQTPSWLRHSVSVPDKIMKIMLIMSKN